MLIKFRTSRHLPSGKQTWLAGKALSSMAKSTIMAILDDQTASLEETSRDVPFSNQHGNGKSTIYG